MISAVELVPVKSGGNVETVCSLMNVPCAASGLKAVIDETVSSMTYFEPAARMERHMAWSGAAPTSGSRSRRPSLNASSGVGPDAWRD
jgi:hypothetical protein